MGFLQNHVLGEVFMMALRGLGDIFQIKEVESLKAILQILIEPGDQTIRDGLGSKLVEELGLRSNVVDHLKRFISANATNMLIALPHWLKSGQNVFRPLILIYQSDIGIHKDVRSVDVEQLVVELNPVDSKAVVVFDGVGTDREQHISESKATKPNVGGKPDWCKRGEVEGEQLIVERKPVESEPIVHGVGTDREQRISKATKPNGGGEAEECRSCEVEME
ncbi:PREDICTED: uncharacterized protein LOC104587483 [Nelumbo nucifera]|uniref:Uncharacterized protein LOC104587483 n=1 Tax=Nelumbo nucifera TaxID=4432 RepID=A0A1U7Z8M6_NELNU|nr:PREDICTED: uncharacterized protein LOC104587483 [Nelumbo nucifera]XP_019051564.1 PREDICTED: uncharacterized protein LOC104587483 [Nelumbo nucifera]